MSPSKRFLEDSGTELLAELFVLGPFVQTPFLVFLNSSLASILDYVRQGVKAFRIRLVAGERLCHI